MEQCWDADPTKRPNAKTLYNKIDDINKSYYQSESNKNKSIIKKLAKKIKLFQKSEQITTTILEINKISRVETSSSRLFTSKTYQFKNLPEPRNATEGNNTFFKNMN
jgi:hypothetical protein